MDKQLNSARLAHIWIQYWNEGRPDDIPLADHFKHSSPFGVITGKQKYLEWVKPLAAKNVSSLKIHKIISEGDDAVIWFEMETPNGTVDVCDWVETENEQITAITSFYDARNLI